MQSTSSFLTRARAPARAPARFSSRENSRPEAASVKITKSTPPMFMAVTWDDSWRGLHAALLLAELKKANVPAELHVYSRGGHGYGIRPSGNPVMTWNRRCEEWMRLSGLLRKSPEAGE